MTDTLKKKVLVGIELNPGPKSKFEVDADRTLVDDVFRLSQDYQLSFRVAKRCGERSWFFDKYKCLLVNGQCVVHSVSPLTPSPADTAKAEQAFAKVISGELSVDEAMQCLADTPIPVHSPVFIKYPPNHEELFEPNVEFFLSSLLKKHRPDAFQSLFERNLIPIVDPTLDYVFPPRIHINAFISRRSILCEALGVFGIKEVDEWMIGLHGADESAPSTPSSPSGSWQSLATSTQSGQK